jgi:uncharacterized membrane protein
MMLSVTAVPAFSETKVNNAISNLDVNVRINTDGSLDVTESVKYTSLGDYNNTMLLIDKQDGEEIEIKNVYMLQKNGYTECKRLSAGQWDANVFSGTYSVIQETGRLRIKVYGTFSKKYGSIVVQYKVNNAVKRYNDVAEYKRDHIFKNWEGRISNINITVYLPFDTEQSSIYPFLHGVLVGKKEVVNGREIHLNIPDTVPGEYAEARIIFPQRLVYKAPYTDRTNQLETFLAEETEYNASDKEELVRARENAAKEAGRRAWADRMTRRAKLLSAIFSILASILGLYTLWKIYKKLHQLKKTPVPLDMKNIEVLNPAETHLLLSNGRLGARAVLGNLLRLVSWGYLKLGICEDENNRRVMTFNRGDKKEDGALSISDGYLLDLSEKLADRTGSFNPRHILALTESNASAKEIKAVYNQWEQLTINEYSDKNILGSTIQFYRNVGLIFGTVLFFLGCIIPVSLSIWSGYSMLIVGLALFLYSLGIRKHTDYGISQYRIWRELKNRLLNRTIALDSLPAWMTDPFALLGYTIALGTEKELELVKYAFKEKDENALSLMLKETVTTLDRALSSIRDLL